MIRPTALFLAAVMCIAGATSAADAIGVESGKISGAVDDGVHIFKGVPFAAPPVGERRWQPPQPVEPWDGVRQCTEFSPECPQAPYPAASLYARPPQPQSEDCLYLNVWTPSPSADAKLPVMVWIHGGGLTRGSGSNPVYDGTQLAKKGVVLVTINYRLGPFGYLAHPELSAESSHGSSGNYGVLDQIAALKWVRNNIAGLGGDPSRVTIFGESAGSWSVNVLMASPLAAGLFQRAIGESGASFRPGTPLKDAEQMGLKVAEAAEADSLAALRELPAEKVLELVTEGPAAASYRTRPNVDGWVLPDDISAIFAAGRHNDVPLLLGSNADEMTSLTVPATVPKTLEAYRERIERAHGDTVDQFATLYPAEADDQVARAYLRGLRDRTFTLGMRTWARASAAGAENVYLYFFTRVPPIPNSEYFGAFHAAEIAYVFDNLNRLGRSYSDVDHQLARTISQYWVNFATSGNPNGAGLPEWKPYDRPSEPYMELGDDVRLGHHLLQQQLDFWEAETAGD